MRGARALHLLVVFSLAASCSSAPASPDSPHEASILPGINERFLAEDMDVDAWVARFEVEAREIYAEREGIVASLGLREGMRVADIGAGTGLFLPLFSEAVGAEGKVVAVEISPRFLEHLAERAKAESLPIEIVEGTDRSVELAEASIDLAFVCDVYHHFEYPTSSLASLMRAIRPGGELVVIDFHRIRGQTSEFIWNHVRAGQDVFTAEIEAAGFELVEELEIDGLTENYALRLRRP